MAIPRAEIVVGTGCDNDVPLWPGDSGVLLCALLSTLCKINRTTSTSSMILVAVCSLLLFLFSSDSKALSSSSGSLSLRSTSSPAGCLTLI